MAYLPFKIGWFLVQLCQMKWMAQINNRWSIILFREMGNIQNPFKFILKHSSTNQRLSSFPLWNRGIGPSFGGIVGKWFGEWGRGGGRKEKWNWRTKSNEIEGGKQWKRMVKNGYWQYILYWTIAGQFKEHSRNCANWIANCIDAYSRGNIANWKVTNSSAIFLFLNEFAFTELAADEGKATLAKVRYYLQRLSLLTGSLMRCYSVLSFFEAISYKISF